MLRNKMLSPNLVFILLFSLQSCRAWISFYAPPGGASKDRRTIITVPAWPAAALAKAATWRPIHPAKLLFFLSKTAGPGFGLASRLAVARLGLATASRLRLLAPYRSGVLIQTQIKQFICFPSFATLSAGRGFEPRLPGPEPGVLPLDDPALNNFPRNKINWQRLQ
jgi:hypothetical protein